MLIESDEGTGNMSIFGTPTTVYLDPPRNLVSKTVGYVKFVFNQTTALEDGTIPVEDDYTFRPEVAKLFGYTKITIQKGTYTVHPSSTSDFGEVVFQCYFN